MQVYKHLYIHVFSQGVSFPTKNRVDHAFQPSKTHVSVVFATVWETPRGDGGKMEFPNSSTVWDVHRQQWRAALHMFSTLNVETQLNAINNDLGKNQVTPWLKQKTQRVEVLGMRKWQP